MIDPHGADGADSAFWGGDDTPTAQLRRIGRDVTSQIRRVVPERSVRPHVGETGRVRQHRSGPGARAADRTGGHQRPAAARRDAYVRRDADATRINVLPYDFDLDDDAAPDDGYAGLAPTVAGVDHAEDARWAELDAWVTPEEDERDHRRGPLTTGGVDPRLLRIGALVGAVVLMVPLAAALGGGDGEEPSVAAAAVDAPAVVAAPVETTVPETIPVTAAVVPLAADSVNASDDDLADAPTEQDGVTDKSASDDGASSAAAPAVAVAVAMAPQPACAGDYTVVAGDYWLRISADSGASADEWLAANDATLETPLYPGDELCIPEGATAPAPPTTTPPTTAPPTTQAPVTTAAPTTAPPTTAPPATTAPPVTTAAPAAAAPATTTPPPATTARPTAPPASGSVEDIIRSVFPDDQEDYAITIATRESRLDPTAWNGHCCYGLFQMYYTVHASWMSALGINSAEDLFDPYLNTLAAYTLWQRSGWSPWSTHYG